MTNSSHEESCDCDDCFTRRNPGFYRTLGGVFQVVEIPMREGGAGRFHALLKEIGELHDKKQKDYGLAGDPFANVRQAELWGVPAWVGALLRANDKMVRLRKVAAGGTLSNEGVVDSLMDLAVYALIALVLYEEATRDRERL